jgi:hypothetical protein
MRYLSDAMKENELGQLLVNFINSLVNGDFDIAFDFLSISEKEIYSQDDLKKEFQEIIGKSPVGEIEVRLENTLEDWEEKLESDIAWAYCSIVGLDYDEGISAVITREGTGFKLRDIEWGRP